MTGRVWPWAALGVLVVAVIAILAWPSGTETRAERAHSIAAELKCLECQGLSVAGDNAVGVYGLDAAYLSAEAKRIGAPTAAELSVAPDAIPDAGRSIAFVGQAGPRPLEPMRVERNARMRA